MAAFQASVNAMPMAWLLAGQALRVAQDLGLHVCSISVIRFLADICNAAISYADEFELCGKADQIEVLVGNLWTGAVS